MNLDMFSRRGRLSSKLMLVSALALSAVGLLAGAGSDEGGEPAVKGAAPGMRLLSETQYANTISSIFGNDIRTRARFAPVPRRDGLTAVGARSAIMTGGAFEPLDASARLVASQVVDQNHRDKLVPCKPRKIDKRDDACAKSFFEKTGLLLYRRHVSAPELARLVKRAGDAVGEGGDFYFGLASALSGMLVSPDFLYIQEAMEPDPQVPGQYRLDAYSKASRLSFFLWNASPDRELLDAAKSGALHDPAKLNAQVDRMIASPRFEQGVRAFFTDLLVLEKFDVLAKDQVIYPAFTLKVVSEAREQMLRTIVDQLVTKKRDYRDLFTTRDTYMSADLATVYRVPVSVSADGWVPYSFPEGDPRAGILTQVGFLSLYSHAGRSSPTQRGRGLRETLLCQSIPDPPPDVDFSIVEDPNANFKTARERLVAHNTDPTCRGCHRLTDGIGLALEHFDGAGQYRATENGAPIDANGDLDGKTYTDAIGLGQALHDSNRLAQCFSMRLYTYGVGRAFDRRSEARLLKYYEGRFANGGYQLPAFYRTLVTSRAFFAVQPPADTQPKVVASNF